MNVEITGTYMNGYTKPDYKNKDTGEIVQGDFVAQIQQRKVLSNGSIQLDNLDVPMDRSLQDFYKNNEVGDTVKVPCNVYGENFAQIKIGKAK